jgi:DNA invertase Pin-like site-specific DNA recombinase
MSSTNGHGLNDHLYARVSTDEQARSGYSSLSRWKPCTPMRSARVRVRKRLRPRARAGRSFERPGMDK